MKLLSVLCAKHIPGGGRRPQNPEKVPFHAILPMELKNRVSGKSDKSQVGGCLQEVTLLTSCLQDHEYENKMCQKEVENLQACYKKFIVDSFNSKKAQEKGILVPGDNNLTHKQIQKLLRRRLIV